jgi:hypothetical protein
MLLATYSTLSDETLIAGSNSGNGASSILAGFFIGAVLALWILLAVLRNIPTFGRAAANFVVTVLILAGIALFAGMLMVTGGTVPGLIS